MSGTSLTPSAGDSAGKPEYPDVRRAEGVTARSSLDLLSLPYPFSQVSLLSAGSFASLANERRSRMGRELPSIDEQILEELHRCGVLTPLFRVNLTPSPEAEGIDISTSMIAQHVHTTVASELLRGASEGRVVDPSVVDFQPWPTERRRPLWPTVESGYLYSRHQLLGLDIARKYVAELKPRPTEKWFTWHLDEASMPNRPTREALNSWRSLSIVLSALDTYYWPQITHVVSNDYPTWQTVFRAFRPPEMQTWLSLSLEQLEKQGRSLLGLASFCDDTGDFYELIRRAKADAWKSLRGDAAVAMDYRMAADILARFTKEVNPEGDYMANEQTPLSQQGLSAQPKSLDRALTGLRLSPFPAVVIAVEGETEYRLVPRVMELLGVVQDRNRIVIVDFGGTERDLSLLARYAVEPVLGRDFGRGVVLDRPLTRFLVMTDAENRYKDVASRNYQRKLLLASLTKNVPKDLRSDYYINTRRGRVVEIRTWGKLPFEFAHFKDSELADAMLSIAQAPHPHGKARLINGLRMQRTRSSAPDVEEVFWRGSGITKPTLADALWPVLEAKINSAIQRSQKGPPVMQVCIRAYEMASVSYGVPLMLRRRRWRPRK
jgi:hypothetical protein